MSYSMSADPSITVAEAFKQFSQVTVSALRAYEHGTRARLTQAEDDLRVLRRERDDSFRDLNACKEQSRAWLAEVTRWKAEADSALVVNKLQADLIAQLRQEAQQWKDQCLRLEESLRGEIKSWKDQFLRIDAERTRLLDQLQSSSSSSKTTLTAHTPKHVPILAGDPSASASASASSSTTRADKPHSPTKALPFPRVVRRVQAVIEVPVKVEEEDGEANRADWPDSTVPQPMSTPTGGTNGTVAGTGGRRGAGGSAKRHKSSASSHQRRRSIIVPPSDDDEKRRSLVEGEEPPSEDEEDGDEGEDEEDGSGEYVDEEEVENAIVNGTPSAAATTTGGVGGGQKAIPWGRKHIGHQPDEEDDELMMYAKDSPHSVRPSHENHHRGRPRPPRRKSNTDVTAQQRLSSSATTTNNPAPVPKRRRTETAPGGGSSARTKRRR